MVEELWRDSTTGTGLASSVSRQQELLSKSAASTVLIDSLVIFESPRLHGESFEHIQALAESGDDLPPIWVHQPSGKVIDGVHRVRAAVLRGMTEISARFFHGDEADVFLLAVGANIRHGLPLSQDDRAAAAHRIFITHPEWSDRMVASLAGLSPKKVAAMRSRCAGKHPQPARRIGRDGRSRPVDSAQGRRLAAEIISRNPAASLREIASAAGISPATAADVRRRVDRGDSPLPDRATAEHPRDRGRPLALHAAESRDDKDPTLSELDSVFDKLRRDPSLRFSDTGRSLLRMFNAVRTALDEQDEMLEELPAHCRAFIADLSCGYARRLQSFGEDLEQVRMTGGHFTDVNAS